MDERAGDFDPYLAEQVRDALAQDPRVGELGVDVVVDGETVTLSGTVASAESREAVADVARELLPERRVRNETATVALAPAAGAEVEHLP
jgi:hypothetical protein